MRTPRVDKPITIPELAELWGRPEWQVRRWLVIANRNCGGRLMTRESQYGKWKTTLGALRKYVPQMVDAGPVDEDDVGQLRGKVRELELKCQALARAHREVVHLARELTNRVDVLEQSQTMRAPL